MGPIILSLLVLFFIVDFRDMGTLDYLLVFLSLSTILSYGFAKFTGIMKAGVSK